MSTAPTHRTGTPSVSVVICVYTEDRWGDILAAVASVRDQSYPALETLLVVDHNPALLRRLAKTYGDDGAGAGAQPVRVLANAGPRGLSAGRNTGIEASRGEVIAFLDDDAVAERDWLLHFAEGYADPRVMAVGGRTQPVWASRRRPAWFPEEFDWVVGCTYRGLPPGKVAVRNVLGGNASFRRSGLAAVGGFASGIGRDGHRLPLGGEETELCIRLTRALPDALLLIDDRSVIHHRVPPGRERFRYFRTRAYAEGLSKALVARSVGSRAGLESERRYTTRVLPAGVGRGLRDALLGRPGGAGRAGAIVAGVAAAAGGYALGTLRARRGGGRFAVAAVESVTGTARGTPAGPGAGAAAAEGAGA
ncbi:glycosyltransferase [Streptomyces sp. NPDC053048]|uniref:glycosyltransferase n=1 Tax=Streptomyces sp. NPDC053048 TaxID=3365694 RepID=UPI0037D0C088